MKASASAKNGKQVKLMMSKRPKSVQQKRTLSITPPDQTTERKNKTTKKATLRRKKKKGQIRVSFSIETASQVGRFRFG